VNTPDINPAVFHGNERPAFEMRLALAATLSGLYGLYNGYEICEATPLPGKEEYLNSEKYELRHWNFDRPGHIKPLIRRLNAIRRENPALWTHLNVRFLNAWNDQILYYFKATPGLDNCVLVMVNMDHRHAQETHFEVPLWEFGLPDDAGIEVEDLLEGHRFRWHGKIQYIRIDPVHSPVKIWRLWSPEGPSP
jgi:starch synthase (maltosyl-transferring)